MCAEPARKIDVPPAAEPERTDPSNDNAAVEEAPASGRRRTAGPEAATAEPTEADVEEVRKASKKLGRTVVSLREKRNEWKKELDALEERSETEELTAREQARFDYLTTHAAYADKIESQHQAAVQLENIHQELEQIHEEEEEDRRIAAELEAKQKAEEEAMDRAVKAKAEKAAALAELEAKRQKKTDVEKDLERERRGELEIESLRSEVADLETRILRHRKNAARHLQREDDQGQKAKDFARIEEEAMKEAMKEKADKTKALNALEASKEVKSGKVRGDETVLSFEDSADGGDPGREIEALQSQVEDLDARIHEHEQTVAGYVEGSTNVAERKKKRLARKLELTELKRIKPGHVIAAAAAAGGLAEALSLKEAKHREEEEKAEIASRAEQQERERTEEAIRKADEKLQKKKSSGNVTSALKSTGRSLGRAALVGGAVSAFSAFGGFHLIGNFFTTWARRISQPHRFFDELYKKFSQETAEPPKGKGAIIGTTSALFWLVAGDAPLAPHDVSPNRDIY
jgi:hypothetical protein